MQKHVHGSRQGNYESLHFVLRANRILAIPRFLVHDFGPVENYAPI
jgi:hypothetical protein